MQVTTCMSSAGIYLHVMAAKPASFLWSEGAGILTTLSRVYRGQPSLGKSALVLRTGSPIHPWGDMHVALRVN